MNIMRADCWPPFPQQPCPPFPSNPIAPPPGCTCGCDPCQCGGGLTQCWNDIQALKAIIAEVIKDMGGPVNTGPIQGVVDGSDAKPGDVGEFVMLTANVNYPVTPQLAYPASLGVLQPGDWDCWVWVGASSFVTDLQINLAPPIPAGFSHDMSAIIANSGGEAVYLTGPYARASLSIPTLIAFQLTTNTVGNGSAAGVAPIVFQARRAR